MAAARMIALGVALGVPAFLGEGTLVDPGFEGKAGKDGRPEGWTFELGATNGATTPESKVELDRKEKHGGKAALRFSGDASTRGWIIAKQPIEVRPGGTYELEAWTQTEGVTPNGFGLDNCYVGLFFFDAAGELAGRELAFPSKPDSAWTKHALRHTAAPHARTGFVYVFLSMIGTLRVDDLALTITGGERLPAPELVLAEDFTKTKRLGAEWKRTVGATNGTGGEESRAEIDAEVGASAPGSLRLAGDADTRRWSHLARELKAEPGELWRWSGKVRAADVVREGPQFQNLHLNLEFLDRRGEPLESARFAALEPGTHDWTPLAVEGVAPEGTKKVRAGLFLSMSGTAWFDDLELTRETGLPVPYGDWITLAGKGVVLRHAPDHPHAAEMKAHLAALEQSKQATCRALDVEFPEEITVLVYADDAQGRSLTGRDLDFADPRGRRVHQRWDSYIGHEMVHVIAHTRLQDAQTGILGEGIAVWLNGQHRSHHGDARKLLDEGTLPSVKDLLERFGEVPNAYPAAGSFCGFLLDAYGLQVFKQLYPLADPSAQLAELEGKRFEDLESAWHEHVRRNG
jgi:hypothetical protein